MKKQWKEMTEEEREIERNKPLPHPWKDATKWITLLTGIGCFLYGFGHLYLGIGLFLKDVLCLPELIYMLMMPLGIIGCIIITVWAWLGL